MSNFRKANKRLLFLVRSMSNPRVPADYGGYDTPPSVFRASRGQTHDLRMGG